MSMQGRGIAVPRETTTLADLLDRVLDKGLVVAGDISVSLANVELLTIRIRLLVCSIDKAEQIGLNWWKYDRELTRRDGEDQTAIGRLEKRIAELKVIYPKLVDPQNLNDVLAVYKFPSSRAEARKAVGLK